MTTRITKPVWREVDSPRGVMLVAITPVGILIRRKRSQTTYGPIPFGAIEDIGAKLDAAARGHVVHARRERARTVGT